MSTFQKVYVPIDPVCCDDYVVLLWEGKDLSVVAYPCKTEVAKTRREIEEDYRLITWHDHEALARVQKELGTVIDKEYEDFEDDRCDGQYEMREAYLNRLSGDI